jgi:uncharacterized membrane protein
MIRIISQTTINKPVEEVFAFVADYRNDHRWRADVVSIRYLDESNTALGSRAVESLRTLGSTLVTESRCVEYEPGRKIVSQSVSGPVPVVATRLVEPADGGTRLTYRLDADEQGVLLYRLLRPVLLGWYQRKVDGYVQTLKRVLEAPR